MTSAKRILDFIISNKEIDIYELLHNGNLQKLIQEYNKLNQAQYGLELSQIQEKLNAICDNIIRATPPVNWSREKSYRDYTTTNLPDGRGVLRSYKDQGQRIIEIPLKVKPGKSNIYALLAAELPNGKKVNPPSLTLSYGADGKIDFKIPDKIFFQGEKVGIEENGKIYFLPITKSNLQEIYRDMKTRKPEIKDLAFEEKLDLPNVSLSKPSSLTSPRRPLRSSKPPEESLLPQPPRAPKPSKVISIPSSNLVQTLSTNLPQNRKAEEIKVNHEYIPHILRLQQHVNDIEIDLSDKEKELLLRIKPDKDLTFEEVKLLHKIDPKHFEQIYTEKLQTRPFRYISLSGGGARGTIYAGAYEALENSNIVKHISGVSGSSAGAITSVLLAAGIEASEYKDMTLSTPIDQLVGDVVNRRMLPKSIRTKDGIPLYKTINKLVKSSIGKYLENLQDEQGALNSAKVIILRDKRIQKMQQKIADGNLADDELVELEAKINELSAKSDGDLMNELSNLTAKLNHEQSSVTFRDLHLMHLLKPSKFKDLAVTAVRRDNGEFNIFSYHTKPDLDIALAARASAAIPLFFKSVDIDGVKYVDGGLVDNIPLSLYKGFVQPNYVLSGRARSSEFTDVRQQEHMKPVEGRILSFAFIDKHDNEAHKALYHSGTITKSNFAMRAFKKLSGVRGDFALSDEVERYLGNFRQNALNSVILDTGDVGMLDFKKATKKANLLYLKGLMETERYLDNMYYKPHQDPSFEYRYFILNILIKSNRNDPNLLYFIDQKNWEQKDPKEMINNFIIKSSVNRRNKIDFRKTLYKTLIKELKDRTIPVDVSNAFAEGLSRIPKNLKRDVKAILNEPDKYKVISDIDKLMNQAVFNDSTKIVQNTLELLKTNSSEFKMNNLTFADKVLKGNTNSILAVYKEILKNKQKYPDISKAPLEVQNMEKNFVEVMKRARQKSRNWKYKLSRTLFSKRYYKVTSLLKKMQLHWYHTQEKKIFMSKLANKLISGDVDEALLKKHDKKDFNIVLDILSDSNYDNAQQKGELIRKLRQCREVAQRKLESRPRLARKMSSKYNYLTSEEFANKLDALNKNLTSMQRASRQHQGRHM